MVLFNRLVAAKTYFVHISAAERSARNTPNECQHVEYEVIFNRCKESADKNFLLSIPLTAAVMPFLNISTSRTDKREGWTIDLKKARMDPGRRLEPRRITC